MQYKSATMTALLGLASAQTKMHVVSVSGNGNTFSPDSIQAAVGEMIQFQFRAGNHSVVQSNFDNPCEPIGMHGNVTGFFSGYQDVAASEAMDMIPTYTVQVTDTKPIWVYCSKATHCQGGMSMVINEK
jgi:plastocyanin